MTRARAARAVAFSLAAAATAVAAQTPEPRPTPRAGSASVRQVGSSLGRIRAGASEPVWFEWKVAVPASAWGPLTLLEAAEHANALDIAFLDASSGQPISAALPKPLDAALTAEERAAVVAGLRAYAMDLTVYRAAALGPDDEGMRKVFTLARDLGVKTIVAHPAPAELAHVDEVANAFGIDVALDGGDPAYSDVKAAMTALEGRSARMGLAADAAWARPGLTAEDALTLAKGRLKGVTLRHRTEAEAASLVARMYALGVRPLFVTVAGPATAEEVPQALDRFETALLPAMKDRVREVAASEKGAIRTGDALPADVRAAIAAALPAKAPAPPKKARRLLVFDLNMWSGHETIRHGNLLLDLLAKRTRAFEPVFSNDLDELKWEKLRKYDAVFLNNVVGMVFQEAEIRDGLTRFVREGGGLGGVHGTCFAALDWPEFAEMLGAGAAPHIVETFTLKVDDPKSPLNAAFAGETDLTLKDELYRFYASGPYSRDKLHVLLSVDVEKTEMSVYGGRPCFQCTRPDQDYAVSWIRSYGKGRVFFTPLGHTPPLFTTPAFVQHLLAGLQFILGDLDADATPSAARAGK